MVHLSSWLYEVRPTFTARSSVSPRGGYWDVATPGQFPLI